MIKNNLLLLILKTFSSSSNEKQRRRKHSHEHNQSKPTSPRGRTPASPRSRTKHNDVFVPLNDSVDDTPKKDLPAHLVAHYNASADERLAVHVIEIDRFYVVFCFIFIVFIFFF